MLKRFVLLALISANLVLFPACSNTTGQNAIQASTTTKIQVVVSFNPIKEFVLAVGKDKVDIKTIIPEGVEPHHFEPKASDLVAIGNARIFIYNGLGMESGWLDKTIKSVSNNSLELVDASKGFDIIKNANEHHDSNVKDNDEHKDDSHHEEHNGQDDPHIWLSLKGAQNEAKNIKDVLIKVDQANKDFYEKNYNDFYHQSESLYNEYKTKFSTVTNKKFVTGHAAFAYLCRDFGLEQNSVEDVFAEGEPSAKTLKELIDFSKKNNIKVIFVEDMVSPKVSETLAKEVSAKTEKISTIESREGNKDYLQSMKENLELIYNSLR